ncbi:hypothetical protein GJAV_G00254560 [Gymnothorax javanicus]|nr:hypothetical protein GJAV_G00254560 [Gymnothorax javanicus]
MMAAQMVTIKEYEEVQQIQISELRTDSKPDLRFLEGSVRGGGSPSLTVSRKSMDEDKQEIYRHPLFPLLALLFEKCEQSTQASECVSSASFDMDILNFVRSQEKEGKAFFSDDPDIDNLMVKAIQVLRIHLLELEKVSDLCKDFCSRYIACLKSKMNSETLLSGEPGSPYSPTQTQSSFTPQGIVVPTLAAQQGNVTVATVNSPQVVAGGTVYQPVTVVPPQGQVVTQALSPGTVHMQNTQQLQLQLNQDLSFFSHEDGSSKNKRGVLPKQATNVMRSWLFQHIGHPYPSEDEKKQLASQTNLTLLQVNNWFINARRRILQPMLDASLPETHRAKKKTPPNRPFQRFWPDSISAATPQQQLSMSDGTMLTVNMDGLQTLSSEGATLAMQQAMMGGHSEDESGGSGSDDSGDEIPPNLTELGLGVTHTAIVHKPTHTLQ